MVVLDLPIYWTNQKVQKTSQTHLVSMNYYRNAHYFNQNKIKKHFHQLIATQLGDVKIEGSFRLNIDLFYKSPVCDGSNIVALIEKFTLDALQERGVIANDNVNFHKGSSWQIIEQDKKNPRCIVSVLPHE